jgi:hypothetical protein
MAAVSELVCMGLVMVKAALIQRLLTQHMHSTCVRQQLLQPVLV